MPDLFDCTPRIAVKLARCQEVARAQLKATQRIGNPLNDPLSTEDDCDILLSKMGNKFAGHAIEGWRYLRTLNA